MSISEVISESQKGDPQRAAHGRHNVRGCAGGKDEGLRSGMWEGSRGGDEMICYSIFECVKSGTINK